MARLDLLHVIRRIKLYQKGVWPYRHAHDVPLVTLILNIYGFVGLTLIIQA